MSAIQSNSARRYRNSNLILLGSVLLYLSTQLPTLIVNILVMAAENKNFTFPISARKFANPFTNTSFLINYSVNFFLYVTVSERFRAQFKQVFGGMCGGKLTRVWNSILSTTSKTAVRSKSDNSTTERRSGRSKAATFVPTNLRKNPSLPIAGKSNIALQPMNSTPETTVQNEETQPGLPDPVVEKENTAAAIKSSQSSGSDTDSSSG